MQAAFLTRPTTGSVRGTRTTPLRDDRAVSLYTKPTPASPLVEEPRQVPWLAYFIGLSAILALVNVFIPQVSQEGPQFSADKAVAQVQKAEYALLPRLLPPWHWELLPFSLSSFPLAAFQIRVVPEARKCAHLDPRLPRIELPGMQIERKRRTVAGILKIDGS